MMANYHCQCAFKSCGSTPLSIWFQRGIAERSNLNLDSSTLRTEVLDWTTVKELRNEIYLAYAAPWFTSFPTCLHAFPIMTDCTLMPWACSPWWKLQPSLHDLVAQDNWLLPQAMSCFHYDSCTLTPWAKMNPEAALLSYIFTSAKGRKYYTLI